MFHYIINEKSYFWVLWEIVVGNSYEPICPGPLTSIDYDLAWLNLIYPKYSSPPVGGREPERGTDCDHSLLQLVYQAFWVIDFPTDEFKLSYP